MDELRAPADAARPHVLLVEDSTLVTDALRLLFEETGHRVSIAPTVRDAITACCAADQRPDVMLLDLGLPDGDGLQTLAGVRAAGGTVPRTAAMTGHDDPDTERRCLEAGCDRVLVKPVPTRELLRHVRELLHGDRPSSSA